MYTPKRGFAQSHYYDQMATALSGMLANASDINLTDSAFVTGVESEDGLVAGIAVCAVHATQSNRPGVNFAMVRPMHPGASDNDVAGIVVRNQWMRTNSKGEACFYNEDVCNVLRASRVGGRIWVKLEGTDTAVQNGKVYCIVQNTGSNKNTIGAFSAAPINGTATPTAATLVGGTFAYKGSALNSSANGGFDIIIDDTLHKVKGCDLRGATTISAVATKVQAALEGKAEVTVDGNALRITSKTTGANSKITYASVPTDTSSPVDISAYLGLTEATGARVVEGSAGVAVDTVEVPGMRFMGTFTPNPEDPANSVAMVEICLR